jgi:two-component system sensor histidine kinase DctS
MADHEPPTPARSPRRIALYLAMPKLAIALLVVSVIGLLWLFQRNEQEERRTTLIADILWLEQNLRFHVTGVSEQFEQLGSDLANSPAVFPVRARHLTKTNPELENIRWLAADGHALAVYPTGDGTPIRIDPRGADNFALAFDRAKRLAKPAYSPPYLPPAGNTSFELFVPVISNGEFAGMIVGRISIPRLLDQMVPWWYAEKYQVSILDDNGTAVARKSNVSGDTQMSYRVPLDPPGHGMVLQADAYRIEGNTAQRVLAGVIIVLAGAVFWSLLALRSHIQRRLKVEQALREANAVRKAMEDSLFTGLRARDLDGRVTYVNPAFCRMTGFAPEELVGRLPPMPYWVPEDMERTLELHEAVLTGRAPDEGFELRMRRKNGEIIETLIFEAPLIDGDGRHIGWMGSVMDITERKRAEALAQQQQEHLQHTARLVTMGEMASTLAHELNQPLAAISSYTTGCLNRLDAGQLAPGDLGDILRKISNQAQRAGRTIRHVHDFVKKRAPQREPTAVAEVIDDSIGLFEADARKRGIHIERRIQGGLPDVLADPHMLGQVMFNLIRNAADAMAETPAEDRRLCISVLREEQQIVVRTADRGAGVPPEVAEKLFTPFYTTKAEGMGMGLSICRSVIEFHAGRLWLEANPEGGSVFIFSLPIPDSGGSP